MSVFDFKISKGKLIRYRGRDSVVRIPDSVTVIDSYVFRDRDCGFVTSIIIPASVTKIDDFFTLDHAKSVTAIEVAEGNKNYKSINGNLYTKDGKTLLQYAIGKRDASFTIPDGVEHIGRGAFEYCEWLESVGIPDSVKSIDHGAFAFCKSLKSVEIPDSVTKIEDWAFGCCHSLKSVRLPSVLTEIKDSTFTSCWALKSITLPKTVTSIGKKAFENCKALSEIIGLDSVTSFGMEAFSGCISLTDVRIVDRNGYLKIWSKAFYNCSKATISVPEIKRNEKLEGLAVFFAPRHIESDAFEGCKEVIYRKTAERIADLPTEAEEKKQNDNLSTPPETKSAAPSTPHPSFATQNPPSRAGKATVEDSIARPEETPSTSPAVTLPKEEAKSEVKAEGGYVFISYSTKNQECAEAALRLVKEEGISAWMAPYDIPAGSKYAHVINNAIKSCSCVLLLLSEESQASEWVEKEIERAINYRKTIISMHLDESQLNDGFSFYLGNQQIVPVKSVNKSDVSVQKVLSAIKTFIN